MPPASKASKAKGQKSITSFFNQPKKNGKPSDDKVDNDKSDDELPADDKPVDDDPSDPDAGDADEEQAKGSAIENSDLPPIHDIPAIFSNLVSRIPEIKGVAEHLKGRKMRVATMCSGTESPLLALNLITHYISEQFGVSLEWEHVFSCEIEPFKQAYIERNFQPPILFRDVCELGEDEATTAYGGLAPVPGDVDLLVAGTSCVDYSNLNNEKQDIDANGESGRTFRGMMSWVKNHRPPLVILENVCSAPWDKVVDYFERNGYSAEYLRVDTKTFYIPHTRTRVYLLAVDQKRSNLPDVWKSRLQKLKRPASSTLDAFLLPTDDPRIHQARQKLANEAYNAVGVTRGRTDWGRCESRHQRARLEEQLGTKRPLTSWEEGGFCKLPDFAWNDWGVGQVERVWDLMDISLLRSAKKGVDPSFKTQVWNLSQNVDRSTGSSKPGICPCLTPSMIPYITNRGGPMVGLEALSMQGLPVNELLLTRETEDQLADLAGNAMSTTVVGACILSALVIGRKLLKDGSDDRTYEQHHEDSMAVDDSKHKDHDIVMEVDTPATDVESHIAGEEQLEQKPLNLAASVSKLSLEGLLEEAHRSARLCICEGRKDMTDRTLQRCADCDSTACVKCGGRPEHNYEPIDLTVHPRLSPSTFEKDLKAILPMSLTLSDVSEELLNKLAESNDMETSGSRWTGWRAAVLRAVEHELRFVEPKRQETWSVVYQSPSGKLELSLHPKQPEWRLFAFPEEDEPANAEIRKLLELPVGRFVCSNGLFSGRWEFAFPSVAKVDITIEGSSELVPSWEQKLGLTGEEFRNKQVHARLEVSVPESERSLFDRDISGVYTLIDKCGTANSALHKREQSAQDGNLPPIFLLLDPTRCGEPSGDSFVFSTSTRRYEYGESRPIIAMLEPKWRQSDIEGTQSVKCSIPCKWVQASAVKLTPASGKDAIFATPADGISIDVTQDACQSATALLVCRVPLGEQAGAEWPRGNWVEVDKVHERSTFKSLAWLVERIRNIDGQFNTWQTVECGNGHINCHRCAPVSPDIRWTKVKKRIAAFEDTIQAGEYERSLKRRPAPFVTQLKLDENGLGIVRIGVNITSLMHRALSRLPTAGRTEPASLSWRLDTDFTPAVKLTFPKFKLASNRQDSEHAQPPSFTKPLRPEQLRSLTWMLQQESKSAPPFIEEEISEAILEPLGWRAEGRAQRPHHIRGGVLADEVGYGKTAISLGLIDCAAADVKKEFKHFRDMKGYIATKATLIIVPPHLTRQWESEVRKFTGKKFTVQTLHTASNVNSLKIEDVMEADIVIVASNLFRSQVYQDNLEAFAGAGEMPIQDGRFFDARLEITLKGLQEQVERLRDEDQGASAFMEQIKQGRKIDEAAQLFVPTKRLKGKSYRDAAEDEGKQSKAKEGSDEDLAASKPKKASAPKPSSSKAGLSKNVSPRTGLSVEVVIPVPPKRRASPASSVATAPPTSEAEPDEESDAPRTRRAVKRKAIVISDDEESEEEAPKKKGKGKAVAKKRPAKRSKASDDSDYEGSDFEASEDEDDDEDEELDAETFDESDEEEEKPKKGKAKAKPKAKTAPKKRAPAKKAKSAPTTSESEDAMDVDAEDDEESKPVGKGKKQPAKKRKTEAKPPKEKKRREDSDPWKLKSAAVRRDWTQMQAPPLEMFHFARKIVDEYTYLDGKVLSMVTSLKAERHWVLSGTPPIHDFGALKTISAFLNIHLGIDDDNEGQSLQVKKRKREQTAVEKFHSFREVHSWEWHAHRHQLGQTFLNQFVRQNVAEIDEISWGQEIQKVVLPAAERAIYLELEHYLRAIDMTVKRGRKSESDREKRLAQALGDSSTAEEALLKRCSHFELETSDKENAMKACEVIVKERKKQLDDCKKELLKKLHDAVKMEKKIGKVPEESLFREYVRVTRTEGVGDKDATEAVQALLDEAAVGGPLKPATNKISDGLKKGARKDDSDIPKAIKDLMWDHREQTHEIRRITKELVGRFRSLRYFTVVRDLQRQADVPPVVHCPSCDAKEVPVENIAVLSSCGHMGCYECVKACAEREECVYAASGACRAAARVLNVVKGDTLGVDDEARDGRGKHYGLKLEKVIHLIKKTIPKQERVLIFVQFPDLTAKVAEALQANDIAFLEIKGSASMKSKNLEKFQNDSKERVLLLNVMDESASGANLTSANHAIFLSPLLAPTQEIYDACETQAIGRLRRYGQVKHVNIWRFFSMNTIDVEIYEQRTKQKVE
ncbi:hypothetical protein L226DRAFT_489066 [Lentinus tigrinus ALCF2SS1-7]|uniref:Helicase ATP-binding domain-containing protein n=1 Tax=Lentinus tigrinus ALCF2SS1-6 TaxID=1328759 RepID=A0A5C2S741_9APHY|nr:hypothetical protein L227DRAFT_528210 [Lentinus tigrinus ALCF2SS1-6]RPD73277.1 hypothetical protein L226DRAFT_489066 [Lentinus tigrinus ALCF2SS1-7]